MNESKRNGVVRKAAVSLKLTRKRLDGFHGTLVVRTIHKGIARFHEKLSGVRDLVVVEGFPQVFGSHVFA